MKEKFSIKSIRTNLGMSQVEFSKYVDMPYRTLQAQEQGQRDLKAKELEVISKKCNVPMEQIEF